MRVSIILIAFLSVLAGALPGQAREAAPTLALISVELINDNAGYEPTTAAETARTEALRQQFAAALNASGKFSVVPAPAGLRDRVATAQKLGACGGCEIAFGRESGAAYVAWIEVQKVSNLILNLNLYVADVNAGRTVFVKSVDMRGNTDDSWSRALKYMLDNYLLESVRRGGAWNKSQS